MHEHELHERFRILRESDAARVPEFRGLLDRGGGRAVTRPRSRRLAPAWIAAAAVIAVAAGVVVRRTPDPLTHATAQSVSRSAMSISQWTSPTAGLLPAPASLLLSPPAILSSILDGAAPSRTLSRGVKQ